MQDDITLAPETLRFILGAKVEHNDYTGLEFQPTGRLVWTPHPRHTVWAAASRAVRTPSRGERAGDFRIESFPTSSLPVDPADPRTWPVLVEVQRASDFDSERVIALELGYRLVPTPALSLDLAGFVNSYDNLRSTTYGTPTPVPDPQAPYIRQPLSLENRMDGKGYGVEVAAEWRALERWHVLAGYTYLYLDLQGHGASGEAEAAVFEGLTPKHQLSLRSQLNLPKAVELDLWLRYVAKLPSPDDPPVGKYVTLDARLGWKPVPALELSLVGQNLLDDRHLEAVSETGSGVLSSEVQRSVYAKATWEF